VEAEMDVEEFVEGDEESEEEGDEYEVRHWWAVRVLGMGAMEAQSAGSRRPWGCSGHTGAMHRQCWCQATLCVWAARQRAAAAADASPYIARLQHACLAAPLFNVSVGIAQDEEEEEVEYLEEDQLGFDPDEEEDLEDWSGDDGDSGSEGAPAVVWWFVMGRCCHA
jgi:hypothetical protein